MKKALSVLLILTLFAGLLCGVPAAQADAQPNPTVQVITRPAATAPLAGAGTNAQTSQTATAQDSVLFYEDFSSCNNIWSGAPIAENTLTIENGYMQFTDTANGTQIRKAVNANGIASYVSFDVMPQENDAYLGLLINYSPMNNYMLRLYIGGVNGSVNNAKVQLYKRAQTTGDSYTLLKESVLLHTLNIDTSLNQWINLSATLDNGTFAVYADGQYLFTYTDTAPVLSGTVGVRCTKGNGRIDNILVRGTPLPAQAPDVSDTPTLFTDDFEDETADADPDYWVETYNNSSIVNLPTTTPQVIFTEDFSATTTQVSRGWSINRPVDTEKQAAYHNATQYLTKITESANWTDYAVEADVCIDESTGYSTGMSASGIVGRYSGDGTGYELSVLVPTPNGSSSPNLRLYDRKAGKQLSQSIIQHTPGATYRLRLEMRGDTIKGFLNGVELISAQSTSCAQGTAGIKGNCYKTYYDNFTVSTLTEYTTHYADHFKTANTQGNLVYRGSADQFATTWLHAFEANPVVQTDLLLPTVPQKGKAGVLGRYASLGGFVQGGYDFAQQKWFISTCEGLDFIPQTVYTATAPLSANTAYTLKLHIEDITAKLYVNGAQVLECYVNQCGYGRVGLFVENATADFDNVAVTLPSGATVTQDVVSWNFYETEYKHYLEVDVFGNEVLGFGNNSSVYSADGGKTFVLGDDKYNTDARNYTSTIEVEKGKYLRIISGDMTAQVSKDQMTWTTVATIVPADEMRNQDNKVVPLIHVSSMTKVTLPSGTTRVFLPVGFRRYNGENIAGHITRVYYTDDGGYTWQQSQNDTTSIPGHDEPEDLTTMNPGTSFCEAKIVSCADGTLRMYNSRNWATCMYYVESTDYGETWSSWGTIPEMPCAIVSFAVCEDPTAPGTWYMVYVKGNAYTPNTVTPRSQLMLCKSTDGKNWTEVMPVDRLSDTAFGSYNSIYQLVDPCLTVTEDYFYFGYARSDRAIPGSPHHDQRQYYLRIGRTDAHKHSYDNGCDTSCNTCGAERQVPDHIYDDDQDTICNECGHIREIAPPYTVGDLNGDGKVTDADAVHLLMHTFFAETYPVNQPVDYNADGKITDADAVYLLMYTFFPNTYPID